MSRTITVALDGSRESRCAADWAAREAELRGLPVRLVQVWEPVQGGMAEAPLLGAETHRHWTERIPREAAQELRQSHPGVEVTTEQFTGSPADALVRASEDAEMLVLGSRGLSGIGGFLVGSVGRSVVAHCERPVVLVRAGQQAADEHETDPAGASTTTTPFRPVVLGLDVNAPDRTLIEFAFEEAARRSAPLRVVHGWNPPYYYAYGMAPDPEVTAMVERSNAEALAEALSSWQQKYPDVEVVAESRGESPSVLLIEASREASLVVVGRRIRRSPIGFHIGTVTQAALHHSVAPVAVVAYE
ncbi:stress-inducible protein [Streptomyces pluripotens]|uniref:Stress-inducible protein n=1 Tax=Streptomyces pluripotens TaxID=1355015 RepID=A0A221P9J2_9ACTN|nr:MULTISPECIES: universal stress protein [Streptomyces]ARP74516.1 stress-inducible protein [Streptomyces pluripotens]ASN28794.1 stress-inducible protein [Streptomyces pluripotens]KIE28567.1 stress-inducible protein [Streptomyces sp. MUSC 125]MCH0560310.1 universal stress protein [Streptomyces sp. MUM 16J]